MTEYVDNYSLSQPISLHPSPFDVARSNADRRYAKEFTANFSTMLVGLEQMAGAICSNVWSPIIFLRGYRASDNFVESAWMALDFDSPDYTLAMALEEWADTVHVIGVTRNHQKDKDGSGRRFDRFRIITPWAAPISDVETYAYNMSILVERYGADVKCKDGGRLFFPCMKIMSIARQGYLQPVLLPPPKITREPQKIYRELGMVRRRTVVALQAPFPAGDKNNLCFECAKDLFDAGYEFQEIYQIIVNSPTYGGSVGRDLSEEIGAAIRSGIKSVKQGKAYGGRQRNGSKGREGEADEEKTRPQEIRTLLPNHHEDEPPPIGDESYT